MKSGPAGWFTRKLSIIKQSMVPAPGGVEEALVITVATGVW